MLDLFPQKDQVVTRSFLAQMAGGMMEIHSRGFLGRATPHPVGLPTVGGGPPIQLRFVACE
jgi:hypothetical protein